LCKLEQKDDQGMIRQFLHAAVNFLFKLLSRVEAVGLDNLPPQGACIVACNHMSRIDPVLVFALGKRRDMTALVADKYKRNPLIRPLIVAVGGIWINREEADIQALREARRLLRNGGMLGIAPEGTRSQTGALIQAKTGTAYLADKAGVPVIPAAVYGSETAVSQLFHFHRPAIHIEFGTPVILEPIHRDNRDADLDRNTDEIMCRIAAMLPERYWGVYAGHPRLKELLRDKGETISSGGHLDRLV
jgi:1-acyl-sn-glycerol-3-phosphate acyltransferase